MTIKEAYQRGNNLMATGLLALTGIAFAQEIFTETEIPYKIDDVLLLVYGIVALIWYLTGRNRFVRSALPVILVALALATKIGAVFLEHSQADDVGDDIGGVILLVFSTILVVWLYVKGKNVDEAQ